MSALHHIGPAEHMSLPSEDQFPSGRGQGRLSARMVQIRKILRFADQRGFAKFDDLDLNSGHLTTTGILLTTKSTRKANRSFAILTDGRDQIQLVLSSRQTGIAPEWFETIQRGSRVLVTGVPFLGGRDETTAVPSLFVVDLHTSSSPAPVTLDEAGLNREIMPRLVIGHLMSLLSKQIEGDGFVRYEPRFITNSEVSLDMEPLMVRFPGRGADLFLEVSPLPQLLYAAIMTGETRLYSPTRLFSRAYRDGITSADSPIIAIVETETSSRPKSRLEDATKNLVSAFKLAEERGLPFDPVPENNIVIDNESAPGAASDSVIIRLRDMPAPLPSQYAYDVRRRVEVETPLGQVLIEGHEGMIAQVIPYNWLCVHVERLATADFWRISQRRGIEP